MDFNRPPYEEEPKPPVEVPSESLSEEVIFKIIESFVLREGTDYGAHEVELDKKIAQVKRQLDRAEIKIIFDPNTESITLMTKSDWLKFASN